jgi:hypothetical protein
MPISIDFWQSFPAFRLFLLILGHFFQFLGEIANQTQRWSKICQKGLHEVSKVIEKPKIGLKELEGKNFKKCLK